MPTFLAFDSELRQVISNLAGNATDVLFPGGRIVLRIRESTDWRTGRKGVRAVVADNGHGMDRETMNRLFERIRPGKCMVDGVYWAGVGYLASLAA